MHTDQGTPAPPIHRRGLYAQAAYRQYNNPNPYLQKLEGVFRFDHVQFDGIDLKQTGINFGGLGHVYARSRSTGTATPSGPITGSIRRWS